MFHLSSLHFIIFDYKSLKQLKKIKLRASSTANSKFKCVPKARAAAATTLKVRVEAVVGVKRGKDQSPYAIGDPSLAACLASIRHIARPSEKKQQPLIRCLSDTTPMWRLHM